MVFKSIHSCTLGVFSVQRGGYCSALGEAAGIRRSVLHSSVKITRGAALFSSLELPSRALSSFIGHPWGAGEFRQLCPQQRAFGGWGEGKVSQSRVKHPHFENLPLYPFPFSLSCIKWASYQGRQPQCRTRAQRTQLHGTDTLSYVHLLLPSLLLPFLCQPF